jgi:hypothetical protein
VAGDQSAPTKTPNQESKSKQTSVLEMSEREFKTLFFGMWKQIDTQF